MSKQNTTTEKGTDVQTDTHISLGKFPIGAVKAASQNVDKDWYLEQLRRRELTQATVAKLMGVDPATLSYAVNGTRELKVKEASALAQILDVPVTEIMRRWGFEVPNDHRTVPVTHWINDDMTTSERSQPFNRTPAPPDVPSDASAAVFRPTHGVGGFWDGMTAFVEPGQQNIRDCVGYACLIITEDKTCLFGVLSRPRDNGIFTIVHPGQRADALEVRVAQANRALWFRSEA
jgi:transcriptional regulator with XRE-family HTH domain